MNRKGQLITGMFLILVFIIFWVLVLADLLNTWGGNYIVVNNASGIEALFYNNLNLVVGFALILAIFGLTRGQ